MLMRASVSTFMAVGMRMNGLLSPEFFSGQVFLSAGNHVHLGGANPTPVYPPDLQMRIQPQAIHGADKDLGRNPGIYQRAQKHVAADPGEAL
jgi:hypothetical protein